MKRFFEESAWVWVAYGVLSLISGGLFVAFLVTGSIWPMIGGGLSFLVTYVLSEGLFGKEETEETSEE